MDGTDADPTRTGDVGIRVVPQMHELVCLETKILEHPFPQVSPLSGSGVTRGVDGRELDALELRLPEE